MIRTAVLIVCDSLSPVRFAGLDLAERAARLARRAGLEHVQIVSDDRPFASAPIAEQVLVLPERVIIERGVITDLLKRGLCEDEQAIVLHAHGSGTDLMLLSGLALERIRAVPRLRSGVRRLGIEIGVGTVGLAARFVEQIRDKRDVPRIETAYLTHTNGGDGEGYFTRNIRVFSVPLSRRLLRTPVTANQVTLAGFALAILAGLSFSFGTYWAGVLGSILYWGSMVLDCSDGEVARGKLGDSKFGAWLETVTDYLSYFLVLAGILYGDLRWESHCIHLTAALIAAVASMAIVLIVGYLRARVASHNPGAFDDALAADLKRGTTVQKFAAWGRQLIKRSFFAHLIVFQALIGQLPALIEVWAYGAVAALIVVMLVQSHIMRSVRIEPLRPVSIA
jgi:phosphatidylglycerophosphate synthase